MALSALKVTAELLVQLSPRSSTEVLSKSSGPMHLAMRGPMFLRFDDPADLTYKLIDERILDILKSLSLISSRESARAADGIWSKSVSSRPMIRWPSSLTLAES